MIYTCTIVDKHPHFSSSLIDVDSDFTEDNANDLSHTMQGNPTIPQKVRFRRKWTITGEGGGVVEDGFGSDEDFNDSVLQEKA